MRTTNLAEYGISKYAYRELKAYCLQYDSDIIHRANINLCAEGVFKNALIENCCRGKGVEELISDTSKRNAFYSERRKFYFRLYSVLNRI